jgi:hypothetical protein
LVEVLMVVLLGVVGGVVGVVIEVVERIVVAGVRGPLELHVADVVAGLDDDPSVQVRLEDAPVVGVVEVEMACVRLLGGVRGEQTRAIRVAGPDCRAKRGQQQLQFGVEAVGVGGKVQQCVALLGQLLGQARHLARQLAVVGVVELGDAAVGRRARRRQAQPEALSHLADRRRMRAKDGNPTRPVPAHDSRRWGRQGRRRLIGGAHRRDSLSSVWRARGRALTVVDGQMGGQDEWTDRWPEGQMNRWTDKGSDDEQQMLGGNLP